MNLKQIRISKNLKQYEVAKSIGVSTMLYSLIETNQCLPTPEVLKSLVKTLGCETADIYSPKELNALKERNKTNGSYNLHGRLPKSAKQVLTKENLKSVGYKDLNDWLTHEFGNMERMIQIEKENKSCSLAQE